MLDGLGVRVLAPQVKRVEFVPRFTPGGDSLWYAVYQPDGSLRVQFDTKGLAPQDQGLDGLFTQAYNRRMGR